MSCARSATTRKIAACRRREEDVEGERRAERVTDVLFGAAT